MNKLYTEEQVNILCQALAEIYQCDESDIAIYALSHFEKLTPIELPTDEEIEKESYQINYGGGSEGWIKSAFRQGAKWMRDKIKGGGDE